MTTGLNILQYLRASGVSVDETLCAEVPDDLIKRLGIPNKTMYIVNILTDDKSGTLSRHFSDYYNRFPEKTVSTQAAELQASFQIFIKQILLGQKNARKGTEGQQDRSDILLAEIEELMCTIREDWLIFSDTYGEIFSNMEQLLPLLQKRYTNPMLASEAMNFSDGMFDDVIPDEYAEFLHDISMMLCGVYNAKIESVMKTPELWNNYSQLFDQIHYIAVFLYQQLNWSIFTLQHRGNSVHDLMAELIRSINTVRITLMERGAKITPTTDVSNPTITYTGLNNPYDPTDVSSLSFLDPSPNTTDSNDKNT